MIILHFAITDRLEDDAHQLDDGTVNVVSNPISSDSVDAWIAMRFRNVQIPQGVIIFSAILSVVPSSGSADEPSHTFYGEAIDDSPILTTTPFDISNRSRTTANVLWDSADLGANGSTRFTAPDMVTIVQEIINRPGWVAGNSLMLMCHGSADSARDLAILSGNNYELNANLDITCNIEPRRIIMGRMG